MSRKNEELSLEDVENYLDGLLPHYGEFEDISKEIAYSAWYGAHLADPSDDGLRRAVLEHAEGSARAQAAALGRSTALHQAERSGSSKRESPLTFALSAKARLDPRVSEFLEKMDPLLRTLRFGIDEALDLASADELVRSRVSSEHLRRYLVQGTLKLCLERDMDLRQASLITAYRLLRSPARHRLKSQGVLRLTLHDNVSLLVPYFLAEGILARLDYLAANLSREYGLHRADIPSLVISGTPARLKGASVQLDKHDRFGALDTIVLEVPAHLEPSEVASLYAQARAERRRPRGLGPRRIALVRRWAEHCLGGGDPHDSAGLMQKWNDEENFKNWRFKERFRFNDALKLSLDRILRPSSTEQNRQRKQVRGMSK